MTEPNLHTIPDAGTLRECPAGLAIIRRAKHEWQERFSGASAEALARLTDKVKGSKFLAAWTLNRQVDWIDAYVHEKGWARGQLRVARERLGEEVGLVSGKIVHTICVRSDGHYVHAYPEKDD